MADEEYKYSVSMPIGEVDRLVSELARRHRPEHGVEIKLTEALSAAVELGNEVNRLRGLQLEWKPIATAPMNLEVLISDGEYVYSAICNYRGGEPDEDWEVGFTWRHRAGIRKPTHWKPMPEPSKS